MKDRIEVPPLPLKVCEDTKITLYLILQIIGKTRMKMAPRKNYWWYLTENISSKGFTTATIPCKGGLHSFEVTLNVHESQIEIKTSFDSETKVILIYDGLTIGKFYNQYIKALDELDIHPNIYDKAFDMNINKHFSEIDEYHHFDLEYVRRFWKIMLWVSSILNEFGSRSYPQSCPTELYRYHADLTISRFPDVVAPSLDASTRLSSKDAFTHELICFGFWDGDVYVREPAFYSYTYPLLEENNTETLQPSYAKWIENNGRQMAFLRYDDLIQSNNPQKDLLEFFDSCYMAVTKHANWHIEGLHVPELDTLYM